MFSIETKMSTFVKNLIFMNNRKKYLLLLVTTVFMSIYGYSQDQISGVVSDKDGIPMIGATVLIQGTNQGTTTDFDGKFSIETTQVVSLKVTYVGFKASYVKAAPGDVLQIILEASNALDEVVITALGIKREEKALGYAVQGITAGEISQVKATNVVNALAGKVAGVSITGSSAGPSASSNITIRGASSLMGNNQPLFIVNGMPITNDLYTFDDGLNGSTSIDFGNAAQVVNSDDIENISILKGPAASALYGSRAASGVILIQTKTGKNNGDPFSVELNSSVLFSSPLKLPNYQNEYGAGGGG
jgi:TonB-dependent SusC/RagA subfamily outer membrane receptor